MSDAIHLLRSGPLPAFAAFFLSLSTTVRAALLWSIGAGMPATSEWLRIFGTGLLYDVVVLIYMAWPLVLWLWIVPRRWRAMRGGRLVQGLLCGALVGICLFTATAEWLFWDEFQTRFNFIAVDYLVYTTEVIGNIRQSYRLDVILPALALATLAVVMLARRGFLRADARAGFASRSALVAGWLLATVAVTWSVDGEIKDRGDNQYADELAGNGIYQFFAAYRGSELDYERFYRTLPLDEAYAEVRALLSTPDATFVSGVQGDITRDIRNPAPERRLNVVLISIESLSAWYSGSYGRPDTLTPELDRLTADSLLFTHVYASGTRTVRGLEALALSVPPTPGESIVKRPDNAGLFSLADVFNAKGYVSQFLYGGYGAFDNMTRFFGHNGYQVRDRSAIAEASIHHANIWGVADEDLYALALSEFDRIHAEGKPFFAHVMTTSNHRPYTFPAGRIALPQGERHSAVAYSDWAVADFLRRARSRPWFDDTVFVITADHCAASGGIARLPVFRYHIPLWIYAPKHIAPGRYERMVAQIDIGPTVLGLLGMDYRSMFYGADVLRPGPPRERALIGNYQRLGYLHDDQLIELSPHRRVDSVRPDYRRNEPQPGIPTDPVLVRQAIAYYQTASHRYAHGLMRLAREPPTAVDSGGG